MDEAELWGAGNDAGTTSTIGGGAAGGADAAGEIAGTVATAGFFLIRFFGGVGGGTTGKTSTG